MKEEEERVGREKERVDDAPVRELLTESNVRDRPSLFTTETFSILQLFNYF